MGALSATAKKLHNDCSRPDREHRYPDQLYRHFLPHDLAQCGVGFILLVLDLLAIINTYLESSSKASGLLVSFLKRFQIGFLFLRILEGKRLAERPPPFWYASIFIYVVKESVDLRTFVTQILVGSLSD